MLGKRFDVACDVVLGVEGKILRGLDIVGEAAWVHWPEAAWR